MFVAGAREDALAKGEVGCALTRAVGAERVVLEDKRETLTFWRLEARAERARLEEAVVLGEDIGLVK